MSVVLDKLGKTTDGHRKFARPNSKNRNCIEGGLSSDIGLQSVEVSSNRKDGRIRLDAGRLDLVFRLWQLYCRNPSCSFTCMPTALVYRLLVGSRIPEQTASTRLHCPIAHRGELSLLWCVSCACLCMRTYIHISCVYVSMSTRISLSCDLIFKASGLPMLVVD